MKATSHAFLFVCIHLSVGPLAWAQSIPVPDTAAGRVLTTWLEAFNSGEKARLEQFEAKYDGRDPNTIENMLRFRANTGGFDVASIRKSTATYIEYMAKERATGRDVVGMLEVTGAEAPRVQNSQLRLVGPGATIVGFEIDAATRKRVVQGVIDKLNESYVFPETARKMEAALRKAEKRGEYKQISNGDQFARLLMTQLQEVSHDKHLRVNFSPVAIPLTPAASAPPPPTEEGRRAVLRENCGFERVERLAGNVGYVKFNQFAEPDVCKETVAAAMTFVANTDAVIFDMRENGGGWPQMVGFITSYLFAERTHLNDFWNRRTGETRESWTSDDVPGKKLTTQPVFVLTAKRTFSGAEEFSYNLKHLKRATIVGEFTGGGAHPVRGERIDERFSIGVPEARPINAVTKTNWEGTGVEPDVQVPAADALATAQKLAAERVRPVGAGPVAKLMPDGQRWTLANLDAEIQGSYCFDDEPAKCGRYGRLYTWEAAQKVCLTLGPAWRLPSMEDWKKLAQTYGGLFGDGPDNGKVAYRELLAGGRSGLEMLLGGGRQDDGYARLEAHGFYWSTTEESPTSARLLNFGKGSGAVYDQNGGQKTSAYSVRCVAGGR
jgi:uncharacterized protein (TIGR02145 family)